MPHQFAAGQNQAGSLANVTPQPKQGALRHARRVFAANGRSYPDGGLLGEWTFTVTTRAEFDALNTQFGVSEETTSALCTLRLLTNDFATFANYNGVIHYPDSVSRSYIGTETVVYRLTALEAL